MTFGDAQQVVSAGSEYLGYRAKDGDAIANAKTVKLPDGRELFSGGSGPGPRGARRRLGTERQKAITGALEPTLDLRVGTRN